MLKSLLSLTTSGILLSAIHADVHATQPSPQKQINSMVQGLRAKGYAVRATIPIFGQLLAISFPQGFVPVTEKSEGRFYLQESVPAGETVENWTQMLTIIGDQYAALNPAVSLERMVSHYVAIYRRACPDSLAIMKLDSDLQRTEAQVEVLSCGTVHSPQESHSESMLLIVLKGTQDYYTIQWATSGTASQTALHLQRKEWSQRLRQLEPIKLCPLLAGEGPPYPSCIGGR